jgi:hypothetical protein
MTDARGITNDSLTSTKDRKETVWTILKHCAMINVHNDDVKSSGSHSFMPCYLCSINGRDT